MPVPIKPLTDLDPAAVDAADAYIAARLAADVADADFRRGVLHDVVQRPHAILEAALQDVVDRWSRSRSLAAIAADPTLADAAAVDAVLSNFRVTRAAAARAAGTVAVVLDALTPVTVPAGFMFSAGGLSWAADASFNGRASADLVVGGDDRLIEPTANPGRYRFFITATATADGPASDVRDGTALSPAAALPHVVTAYARGDFTGGRLEETNLEVLQRLEDGMSLKAPSNRATTRALLLWRFPEFSAVSEVGLGDPEALRSHGLLPVSFAGRRDVWVRAAGFPLSTVVRATATLTGHDVAGAVWQVALGRADAPGFYDVASVAPADSLPGEGLFGVVQVDRGVDLGSGWAPDVQSPVEAAFTAYQTALVKFVDPVTVGLPVGSTRQVDVTVLALPSVRAAQDFLGSRDRRPHSSDVLIRAAVPCLVSVEMTVRAAPGSPAPDTAAVAAAVAAAVNSSGFPGRLPASGLATAALSAVGVGYRVESVAMSGRLSRPDGTVVFLRSADALVVPDEPKRLVSRRTTAFYSHPDDVAVTVVPE